MRKQDSIAPIPVRRALRKLGQDIRDARRRRRIPMEIMAERASISRTTLTKVEKGDPGVSIYTRPLARAGDKTGEYRLPFEECRSPICTLVRCRSWYRLGRR